MRNDGEAIIPTIATIIGGVLNAVLDVLLVFTFDMGIKGAGLATGIGQFVAFLIIASYFFTKKCNLKFTKPIHINDTLLKIATVGSAVFVIEIASGVTSAVYNITIMENLSKAHLAVFGTTSTVVIMFYCLFGGIGTALQPMVATAFGAANHERIKKTLRLSFLTSIVMGVIFFALCELFPGTILRIYMDVTDEVMAVGPRIVRLYSLAIPAMGISMVCNYYFQSTLHRSASLVVSLLRGLIFPVIFVLTLPIILNHDYLWLATPIGEVLTCAIAVLLIIPMLRALKDKKDERTTEEN
jgi:Na+-driven multidrug efflux pump